MVTTNITQGGKGDPSLVDKLPRHLLLRAKKLAERSSRALGFNLAGVDVILGRNLRDIYVVDVNTFPGFPKRRTFDLTGSIIKELVRSFNKGTLHFEKPADN